MLSNAVSREKRNCIPDRTKVKNREWNWLRQSLRGLPDGSVLVGTIRSGFAGGRRLAERERGGPAEHDGLCQAAKRLAVGPLDRQECPGLIPLRLESSCRGTDSR